MNHEDAEEYTQALGQVVSGGWRQVALGERLGVPDALGLSTREWVEQRLGGYIRQSVPERREAVAELTEEGMSTREIGDVLGVGVGTVTRDRQASVPDGTPEPETAATPQADTTPEPVPVPDGTPEPEPAARTRQQPQIDEEELALRDLFTSICEHVYRLAPFGGYPDLNTVMADYDPERYVDPPEIALSEDRLLAARRFCDIALDWMKEHPREQ